MVFQWSLQFVGAVSYRTKVGLQVRHDEGKDEARAVWKPHLQVLHELPLS